jgi:hypothetical protein
MIARGDHVTYSSEHAADGWHMTQLLDTLNADVDELRRMLIVYDDAVTMPGRLPDVDADGGGRQATHGPSRPTERTALDPARVALIAELKMGAQYLAAAIAYVRGVTASMDRSLSLWEGEA